MYRYSTAVIPFFRNTGYQTDVSLHLPRRAAAPVFRGNPVVPREPCLFSDFAQLDAVERALFFAGGKTDRTVEVGLFRRIGIGHQRFTQRVRYRDGVADAANPQRLLRTICLFGSCHLAPAPFVFPQGPALAVAEHTVGANCSLHPEQEPAILPRSKTAYGFHIAPTLPVYASPFCP